MKITASLPGAYANPVFSISKRNADERKDASLKIASQLDRIRQESKASGLPADDNNKQAAMQKAAILRQRLEMLKAMMRFATPELAKSLARELKGISKELASLGQAAGGGGSASASAASADSSAGAAADASSADTPEAKASESGAADEGAAVESGSGSGNATAADGEQKADGQAASMADDENARTERGVAAGSDDDQALREAIQAARRLLKELIGRVKALARAHDSEARRDLQAAEESIGELDQALEQGSADSLSASIDAASSLSVGGTIDITA